MHLEDRKILAAAVGTGLLAAGFYYRHKVRRHFQQFLFKKGSLTIDTLPQGCYDAVIVGAGTILIKIIVLWREKKKCDLIWRGRFPVL